MEKERVCKVKVQNVDSDICKYIVARVNDGVLWYWGSWDDLSEALRIARNIDGVVVENE